MSFIDKLRSWWRKDELETAEEEARMTPAERDVAEEDYEARKDDAAIGVTYAGGEMAGADFEEDSEPSRDPAP
jgi:hypothetical protein